MKTDDISIDLETTSNKFNSAILSIGACRFDRVSGKTQQTYYAEVQIDDALRYGKPNADTLKWWMRQSPQAQAIWQRPEDQKLPLFEALRGLTDFVRSCNAGVKVWGNGASFDLTILEHAYERAGNGLVGGWEFWDIRDMRTILDATKVEMRDFKRNGVYHNALDDAVFQAEVMCAAWKKQHEMLRAWDKAKGSQSKPAATPVVAPAAVEDEEL